MFYLVTPYHKPYSKQQLTVNIFSSRFNLLCSGTHCSAAARSTQSMLSVLLPSYAESVPVKSHSLSSANLNCDRAVPTEQKHKFDAM